jgi:hypothetical protein
MLPIWELLPWQWKLILWIILQKYEILFYHGWDGWVNKIGRWFQIKPIKNSTVLCCIWKKKEDPHDRRRGLLIGEAHIKAKKMLFDCFGTRSRDQQCIICCLVNSSTAGVFLTVCDKCKKLQHRRGREKLCKMSIVIVAFNEDVHCLAAVNYFRHQQFTQVIYLGTTMQGPPHQSKHITYQRNGLTSYLPCILVKQHTYGENMNGSVLSLQINGRSNMSSLVSIMWRTLQMTMGFLRHPQHFRHQLNTNMHGSLIRRSQWHCCVLSRDEFGCSSSLMILFLSHIHQLKRRRILATLDHIFMSCFHESIFL